MQVLHQESTRINLDPIPLAINVSDNITYMSMLRHTNPGMIMSTENPSTNDPCNSSQSYSSKATESAMNRNMSDEQYIFKDYVFTS